MPHVAAVSKLPQHEYEQLTFNAAEVLVAPPDVDECGWESADVPSKQQNKPAFRGSHQNEGPASARHNETRFHGTMKHDKKNFGFIQPDDGSSSNIFVLPVSCEEWNGTLPSIGTRVSYEIVTDQKTGKPRAENVKSLDGQKSERQSMLSWESEHWQDQSWWDSENWPSEPSWESEKRSEKTPEPWDQKDFDRNPKGEKRWLSQKDTSVSEIDNLISKSRHLIAKLMPNPYHNDTIVDYTWKPSEYKGDPNSSELSNLWKRVRRAAIKWCGPDAVKGTSLFVCPTAAQVQHIYDSAANLQEGCEPNSGNWLNEPSWDKKGQEHSDEKDFERSPKVEKRSLSQNDLGIKREPGWDEKAREQSDETDFERSQKVEKRSLPQKDLGIKRPKISRPGALQLEDCRLGDDGLKNYLKKESETLENLIDVESRSLEFVNLSGNDLTDVGLGTLVDFLQAKDRPLKRLDLSQNRLVEPTAICEILQEGVCGLSSSHGLRQLDLSGNPITDSGFIGIFDAIFQFKINCGGTLFIPFEIEVDRDPPHGEASASDREGMFAIIAQMGLRICFVKPPPSVIDKDADVLMYLC
eukprot:gnl/MRDRNA2_/MRDRNA2_69690_c0_seq1.p1 gnl/MRDRNA2_/MRDRNA2_69690_c0~~gnl/MRDRNA2_/MRDRNA2_69690_c0_seq1.p1  ORF type:complete len:635 (+),score=130.35 gnl/MRDRNA2_/MRDRNA2_69690_c0_seq1:164-1906(+)